jgi:hypothetical protein
VSDAELYAQIDVNEYFDAFIAMDLHNTGEDSYGLAKSYYVRWKNICNTGFGLKVGRDDAPFGDPDSQVGYLDTWAAGMGDGAGRFEIRDMADDIITPMHNGWKYEGVTQITPYWEGIDGALKVELSLFQNVWNDDGLLSGSSSGASSYYDADGVRKYRSKNLGVGSGSLRVQYTPLENLTFTAGVINFKSNGFVAGYDLPSGYYGPDGMRVKYVGNGWRHAANNTAVNLAFRYTPCFFERLTVWGQYLHGWNISNFKNFNAHTLNAGFSLALTDSLSWFAQGDYVRTKWTGEFDFAGHKQTSNSYAFYTGLTYELPMGAVIEAGWRHEYSKWKYNGDTMATGRADTIYANVGFEF